MKIAIYDGILETHVASSLERALLVRGHEVYNTGKIGHGFKFPRKGSDMSHLEAGVAQVVDFAPDVCFVMRPASLPTQLLRKIKRSGITMIAWFSDDPVLFELSYGPVVDLYDLVLHCGNERVLKFYENRFGRPTGVNFPFWTDHQSFPYVWGKSTPTTDMMFLGNVQDNVRRARYFQLAQLNSQVRIHGNVGADFFRLSGGYLDGDAEVVAAGSTAKAALNIPQFFSNHRGLETWFKGLGDLGFFEYPSRVIQYMAMGIPTISVVPEAVEFKSYPEMYRASSVEEADEYFQHLERTSALADLSKETVSRFDRNFSALSRVMALENLLASDDWKGLDSREREVWFTQFDATDFGSEALESKATRPKALRESEASGAFSKPSAIHVGGDTTETLYLLGRNVHRATSRIVSVAESAEDCGFDVEIVDVDKIPGMVLPDPSNTCDSALGVQAMLDLVKANNSVVGVCDGTLALTKTAAVKLAARGVTTFVVDDSNSSLHQATYLASNYDKVFTSNKVLQLDLSNRGFKNVEFLPRFTSSRFNELLDAKRPSERIVRIYKDAATERVFSPAFLSDVDASTLSATYSFDELNEMNLQELAAALSASVTLLSYEGTRQLPRLNDFFPYIFAASAQVVAARVPDQRMLAPYDQLAFLVEKPGELTNKLGVLSGSDAALECVADSQSRVLDNIEVLKRAFVGSLLALKESRGGGRCNQLNKGASFTFNVELDDSSSTPASSVKISLGVRYWYGNSADWLVTVYLNGSEVCATDFEPDLSFVVRTVPRKSTIRLVFTYRGKNAVMAETLGMAASPTAARLSDITSASYNVRRSFPVYS